MRVLFVTYELPPLGGGGGRAAWQVARRLAARGHAVCILTTLFDRLPEEERREGVEIRRIRARRRSAHACPPRELLSFMLRSLRAVLRLADAFRPEVVCAFFAIPGGPAAWRLLRKRGTPYVLSLRGSDVPRPELARYQRLHLFTRPFLRRMLRDAEGILAVSEGLRQAAHRLQPGLEIQVVPNGVDTDFFRPPPEKDFSRGPHEILFVGRLQEFKGVQHLLGALPFVERCLGEPVVVNVVGDGPYRRALEVRADQARAAGVLSEVRFLGWLDAGALRAAYESASLFVLPSLVEGHPNVLMEALAMGVPCVASDAAGPREVVSHGREGLLVPPGDERALADAVAQVLGSAETWRAMSRAARQRAEQFSWDGVADRYESSLARAAGREIRPAGPPSESAGDTCGT